MIIKIKTDKLEIELESKAITSNTNVWREDPIKTLDDIKDLITKVVEESNKLEG